MAWSSEVLKKTYFGDMAVVMGNWDGAAVTGGDIATGLKKVYHIELQHKGTAVEAAVAVVNETMPLNGGDVTVVCTSGDAGTFIAIGHY